MATLSADIAPHNFDGNRISVVIPVFRNSASLSVLIQQIDTVMAMNKVCYEILFIDDSSDDDSWEVIMALTKIWANIRGFRLNRNRGQHVAVLFGLFQTRSPICIVMDADLQDSPEAITLLLKTLQESRADVIFAGRIGSYQSWIRMATSRIYRSLLLKKLVGLPSGAGMFFLITRSALERVSSLLLPGEPMVIGMIAAARLSCVSIPVQRSKRTYGQTAYTTQRRMRSAIMMVNCALFTKKNRGYPLVNFLSSVKVSKHIKSENILR